MKSEVRKRPALFRALGNDEPPHEVSIGGEPYRLETVYKHDSWAATAVYANGSNERAICKFNRRQPIFVVPMGWLGRRLASREADFLNKLSDVDLVPRGLGAVSADGTALPNAMARRYIEGTAFRFPDQVDEDFFLDLRKTLDEIHAHDIAYVDLHKRENILIGEDGRPYLLDFQVSYGLRHGRLVGPLSRFFLKQMQEMDDYTYSKHLAKCCPQLMTDEDRDRYARRTAVVRLHRKLAKPFKYLRLKLLIALGIRDASGRVESEFEPEIAFRARGADDGVERRN